MKRISERLSNALTRTDPRLRNHRGVILYGPNDDRDALLQAAIDRGEVTAGYGVALLPRDAPTVEAWEAGMRERAAKGQSNV